MTVALLAPDSLQQCIQEVLSIHPDTHISEVISRLDVREFYDEYIMLPDTPALQQMRHEWVLRRANRPYVPEPDSTPMLDSAASQEDKTIMKCLKPIRNPCRVL